MNTLFAYETLASFGNWAFWLVAVFIVTMGTIIVLRGKMNYIVPSFTVEKHPFLQKVLRISLLLTLLLCPFVRCDYIFHGLDHPFGRAICVYLAAFFGLYLVIFIYFVISVIIYCVGRMIYWALDKKWPDDD